MGKGCEIDGSETATPWGREHLKGPLLAAAGASPFITNNTGSNPYADSSLHHHITRAPLWCGSLLQGVARCAGSECLTYGSIVWTMIIFHSFHVLSVVLKNIVVLVLSAHG
jgi:hypothetical protein